MTGDSFTFEYRPGTIHNGREAVADLGSELERHDLSRAMIVTDSTIADVPAVMEPVREGLGDRLAGTFEGVTPGKYLATAYEAAKRVREEDVDALVGLGGGSSLDVAKITSVLVGHDRPLDDVVEEIVEREAMVVPEAGSLLDLFAVPTTIPGADLSQVAGVQLSLDPEGTSKSAIPNGGVSDARLMPTAVFHDVGLVSTTPDHILARSAMNGFDKGIEMLYTRHHTPITDATATRGVRLLHSSLPAITDETTDEEDLSEVLEGIALAQYGLSTPREYRASIVHAFGHALSRNYDVQQGVAHAIAVPHVLEYLFEQVDGRRDLLAHALGIPDDAADEETARRIVAAVEETRDALDLPSELRSVDGADRADFTSLAEAVIEDAFMAAAPRELEPTRDEIEPVFEAMW